MNLSAITQRTASVLTIIIGVTCAVGVLVSMLAMGTGARRQQMGHVRADRVVLTTTGARAGQSNTSREEGAATLELPGIRRGTKREAIVVFESVVFIEGRRRVTGNRIYFPLVGITPSLTDYQPETRFTGGRMFQSGRHELIASNACARQFTGFDIGDRRPIHGNDWTVVGRFDEGQAQQCVVYADVDSIMSPPDARCTLAFWTTLRFHPVSMSREFRVLIPRCDPTRLPAVRRGRSCTPTPAAVLRRTYTFR